MEPCESAGKVTAGFTFRFDLFVRAQLCFGISNPSGAFNHPIPAGGGAATAAAARIYSHNALQIPKVNVTSSNNWTHKRINDARFVAKRNRKHVSDAAGAVGSSLFFSVGNVTRF